MKKIFKTILIPLLFFLLVYLFILPGFLLKYHYYPSNELSSINDKALKSKIKSFYLYTPDKVKLNMWYIKAKKEHPTIIFCYGDAGNVSDYQELAKSLTDSGNGLLMFDYRGFGRSTGYTYEKGVYTDLKTVVQYLKNCENISENQIILWGYSFGGAVVAEMASHEKFKGVILHSTFTNAKDMRVFEIERLFNARNSSIGDFLVKTLIDPLPLDQKYDTKSKVSKIKSPLLIAHDMPDEVVPVKMSYKLLKLNPKAQAFISKTGSHGDFSWVQNKVLAFIKTLK
jgi:uncharacterized protein